jgi:hypothetical protein
MRARLQSTPPGKGGDPSTGPGDTQSSDMETDAGGNDGRVKGGKSRKRKSKREAKEAGPEANKRSTGGPTEPMDIDGWVAGIESGGWTEWSDGAFLPSLLFSCGLFRRRRPHSAGATCQPASPADSARREPWTTMVAAFRDCHRPLLSQLPRRYRWSRSMGSQDHGRTRLFEVSRCVSRSLGRLSW